MGASESLIRNNIFVSVDTTCSKEIKNAYISKINEYGYTIINQDYIDNTEYHLYNKTEITNHILIADYIVMFISSGTLKSNIQSFIDYISCQNNKRKIYLILEPELLPLRNNGIKLFVGKFPAYPCFDNSSCDYSLRKIKHLLMN